MKAELKNYPQSPRKMRLIANLIKGKTLENAFSILSFSDKKAAEPFAKLLRSAVANAKHNFDITSNTLVISDAQVDKGIVNMRRRPRARGSAFPIRHRTSHVWVELRETEGGKPAIAAPKKAAKKKGSLTAATA